MDAEYFITRINIQNGSYDVNCRIQKAMDRKNTKQKYCASIVSL